ncbi:MAG: ion transporter [Methanobrevibacter sp.]|nr:ion transporter [Methanobrevibacter sp.]
MKIFGNGGKVDIWYNKILPYLIISDLVLITISFLLDISDNILYCIEVFDFVVCVILLFEYFTGLMRAPSKKDFILNRDNILALVASIPFDVIIYLFLPVNYPGSIFGYLRLLRLIRIISVVRMGPVMEFFEKTGFHKIILAISLIILASTAMLCIFGTSYNPFDYFYFVIVTLTTVGYGDITPQTYNERVMTIFLVLIGIIFFSTITASISSFLTDNMLEGDGDEIDEVKKSVDEKSERILSELDEVRKENRELKAEIDELKELIKNK